MIVAVTVIVTVGTGNEVCGNGRPMRWRRELSVGRYGEAVWSLR